MKIFDRIQSNPAILNGQPTIRGMRITVPRVVEAGALYPNWDDLRKEYPELEPDIRQALEFAACRLEDEPSPREAARSGCWSIKVHVRPRLFSINPGGMWFTLAKLT
jgi:uncharacterized protein (DUF433 family)